MIQFSFNLYSLSVPLTLLRVCFHYDLQQPTIHTYEQKNANKIHCERSRSFSYTCIMSMDMHWMTMAHTLLHSLDLRKLNQNDLEFRLARKPYDYFLFGSITNLYENHCVRIYLCALCWAQCALFENWLSTNLSRSQSTKHSTKEK